MKNRPCFKTTRKYIALLLALAFLPAGCVNFKQPYNKITYYTLEYAPPEFHDLPRLPAVIRLENFTVSPSYNTDKIIYSDQAFTRSAYVYHKWHANPGKLVGHFLNRDIDRSGLFTAVLSSADRFKSHFILTGSVDEFYELDEADKWKAVLTASVTLHAANEPDVSRQILFQKTFTIAKICEQRHPQALSKAMSQAMAIISQDIITTVYKTIEGSTRK